MLSYRCKLSCRDISAKHKMLPITFHPSVIYFPLLWFSIRIRTGNLSGVLVAKVNTTRPTASGETRVHSAKLCIPLANITEDTLRPIATTPLEVPARVMQLLHYTQRHRTTLLCRCPATCERHLQVLLITFTQRWCKMLYCLTVSLIGV